MSPITSVYTNKNALLISNKNGRSNYILFPSSDQKKRKVFENFSFKSVLIYLLTYLLTRVETQRHS